MVNNFFAKKLLDFYFLPLLEHFKLGTGLATKNIKMVPPLGIEWNTGIPVNIMKGISVLMTVY